jgi:hypothetical protein
MSEDKKTPVTPLPTEERKPNENAGFYFSSSIKITDPETGQVLVQMRCD